jgi:CRP/FNR family transcriptional regulator, cyclic AMP receptor protein
MGAMARKAVKIGLLRRVPLFERCSRRELAHVASIGYEDEFPAGQELTREGERGRQFFVLLEGAVTVRKGGGEVATIKEGDFFGETALVSHGGRTATVTATTPVRALIITDRNFRSLLGRSPSIQAKVLEALADRLTPSA